MAPHPKIYGIYIFNNKHINLMILIIQDKGLGNYSVSEEKIFEKVYDVRWTPSDGTSSPGELNMSFSIFYIHY
jgi:hypothetical protein